VKYILGLDLGQRTDHTALVVVELQGEQPPYTYQVPYLQRFPLGTSYPDIVKTTLALLRISPLFGDCQLVIDLTGVGLAIGDLFRLQSQAFIGIVITGGMSWRQERWDEWHVSKHLLVSTTQKVLSSGALAVSQSLPEAETLRQELRDFRAKVTKTAAEVYEAREGQHDDLILSLAIALFVGEQFTPVESW
jgi:hypothetical protein